MHGEIYSGLSDQTVLTINQNCFLEKFPGPDDREVLPLATLSAEYDPDVLDLYSRIVSDLPVAVPVMENGLGDWFYDAASTAAKYLGPVLSALPHPMLKGAGVALEGLSSVMEGNNKPKKKRKQTQQAAKQNLPPPNSWGPMVPAARRQQQRNAAKQQPARAGQKPKRKRRNNRA
jgi:hypothetical protein